MVQVLLRLVWLVLLAPGVLWVFLAAVVPDLSAACSPFAAVAARPLLGSLPLLVLVLLLLPWLLYVTALVRVLP
jgi:hypothetical protein